MRWNARFDDLEAQLAHQSARELAAEVAERSRAERARIELSRRLLAHQGRPLRVRTPTAELAGTVQDVAPGWIVLADAPASVLVPTHSVQRVDGLGREVAAEPGRVLRALTLGHALRALARDRAGVCVTLGSGESVSGTIDWVGADHIDLALHAAGELRRARSVAGLTTVAFAAIDHVRRGGP